LAQNSEKQRGRWTIPIVLAACLAGFLLVTIGRSTEQKSLYADNAAVGQQALASDTTRPASVEYQPMAGKGDAAISMVKMLVALGVVVVAIYIGIFLLKKLMNRRHTAGSASNLLQVLETAYLDPKKSLSLVRVADKSVLIGVTDNQISVLTEFDSEHTEQVMKMTIQQRQGEGFMSLLKSASDKFSGRGTRTDKSEV